MTPELQEIEVKPKQPWKPTQKEINTNIGIFVLNILLTLSLIQFIMTKKRDLEIKV